MSADSMAGFNGTMLDLGRLIDMPDDGHIGDRDLTRAAFAERVRNAVYALADQWRAEAEPLVHHGTEYADHDQEADDLIAGTLIECAARLEVTLGLVDTAGSASRQHYIETGRYLRPGEEES